MTAIVNKKYIAKQSTPTLVRLSRQYSKTAVVYRLKNDGAIWPSMNVLAEINNELIRRNITIHHPENA